MPPDPPPSLPPRPGSGASLLSLLEMGTMWGGSSRGTTAGPHGCVDHEPCTGTGSVCTVHTRCTGASDRHHWCCNQEFRPNPRGRKSKTRYPKIQRSPTYVSMAGQPRTQTGGTLSGRCVDFRPVQGADGWVDGVEERTVQVRGCCQSLRLRWPPERMGQRELQAPGDCILFLSWQITNATRVMPKVRSPGRIWPPENRIRAPTLCPPKPERSAGALSFGFLYLLCGVEQSKGCRIVCQDEEWLPVA
mmetsp:Transcript_63863/g.106671  ORF Transcript_63863/g.106671 Transcript_63863/m.106671 type:complete len:247 (+) Transcript_63863:793-1533(+)